MLEALEIDLNSIIMFILLSIGYIGIIKKCGQKAWYGIIPVYRSYKFAECIGMEEEGRTWALMDVGYTILQVVHFAIKKAYDGTSRIEQIINVLEFVVAIMYIVYSARIFYKLTDVFAIKHRKLVTFILTLASEFALLVFALRKKLQPVNLEVRDDTTAALSGVNVEHGGEGLTINIEKREAGNAFNKKTLLRDIHLHIDPGRMVLLLGGSGAGKTTFLNAVTGYEKADAKIIINNVDAYEEFEKVKYKIGFVPQQDLLRYEDTVYRTLQDSALLRLPISVKATERHDRINNLLDVFGLTTVKDSLIGKLSGGQKKRISIATEFISDPSIFILDEPDSGLDGIIQRDLMKGLNKIAKEGKIVIVITHSADAVIDLFDDVIVLAKDADRTGRLAYYGPVDEARKFFGKEKMVDIVKMVNCTDEGGEGMADQLIEKFGEVQKSAS